MKRLVVGVFVSAVAVVGVAPAASAAPHRDGHSAVAKVKVKKPKIAKIIDWDAPKPAPGRGYSIQRIDWD